MHGRQPRRQAGVLLKVGLATFCLVCVTAQGVWPQGVPHATLPDCQRGDPELLLPDLLSEPPRDLRDLSDPGRRYTQFTTAVGNVGDGPLVLEGRTVSTPDGLRTQAYQIIWRRDGSRCARQAGQFEFQEQPWHFERFITHEVLARDPYTGPLLAGGVTTSSCLLDVESVQGYHPVRFPRQLSIDACNRPEGQQGISVGWKVVYHRNVPGQSISFDTGPDHQLPTGTYYLAHVVDPDHLLWEKDVGNNTSYVPAGVNLPPPIVAPTPAVEAPTEQPRGPGLRMPRYRPPRPTRPARLRRPGRAPLVSPTPTPLPTPVAGSPPSEVSCDNACRYSVGQLRMTWYDALGLHVSGFISPGLCEPLHPDPGKQGTIQMVNWLTARREDTGLEHKTTFVMGNGGIGTAANGGTVILSESRRVIDFAYTAPVRPLATASTGSRFPVVFDTCLTVGDQAVAWRLVCQPKNTGMLCH